MTREYTAIIPAMTTGIKHCRLVSALHLLGSEPRLAFMIRSGLKVPTPAMPIPAFAVPKAAPAPEQREYQPLGRLCRCTYSQRSSRNDNSVLSWNTLDPDNLLLLLYLPVDSLAIQSSQWPGAHLLGQRTPRTSPRDPRRCLLPP